MSLLIFHYDFSLSLSQVQPIFVLFVATSAVTRPCFLLEFYPNRASLALSVVQTTTWDISRERCLQFSLKFHTDNVNLSQTWSTYSNW